jgi:hypothetical protein
VLQSKAAPVAVGALQPALIADDGAREEALHCGVTEATLRLLQRARSNREQRAEA